MTAQQRHGDGDRNQGGDGAGCAIDSTVGPVGEGSLQLLVFVMLRGSRLSTPHASTISRS